MLLGPRFFWVTGGCCEECCVTLSMLFETVAVGALGGQRGVFTWRHTGWRRSNPWWWPLPTWWWTACWEAPPGFVSWVSEGLWGGGAAERWSGSWASCTRNWSMRLGKMKVLLTLHGFKFLLQRHQLQPEELGHLLVLLSLPSGQNVGFRKRKHNQGSCKLTSDSVIENSKSQFCSCEMKAC